MLIGASAAQAALSFVILGLPAIGPQLRERFGLSLAGLGVLLAAMQFGSGIALIAAGAAADRWGPCAATRFGTALATLGLVLGAAANSTPELIVGLFIAGVGGAIVPVSGAGAIFRTYPVGRRAWALGVRQMAVPVGGMIAAVAVPTLEHLGGTSLVLWTGAVAVAVIGNAYAAVSEKTPIRHDDSVGIVRGIWRVPGLGKLFVVTVTYLFVLQAVLSYTVPAVRAAGFSAFAAGAAYFLVNATAIISRVIWGRVADRDHGTRRRRTLVEVGTMSSVGALLFGLALHASIVAVLFAVSFFGFAALGWNAIVYAVAGEWATPARSGRAFAVAATVVFVGAALVNPVIGALAEWAGWNTLWLTAAVVALIGTAVARTLPDHGAEVAGG